MPPSSSGALSAISRRSAWRSRAPPTARDLAHAALRGDYEDYLRRQRGLSERTIGHCWRFADRFLDFRFGKADVEMSAIRPGDIVAFLQRLTARKAPFRDKTPPTHLRNFFQYLFKSGLTASNLALCVPSVAQRYGARLPRHLTPDQVESAIGGGPSRHAVGCRNYAMVLLLARLGLRAPEVVAIQLDDIDWRAGELVVRGKGQNHDRVPIPPDLGEALDRLYPAGSCLNVARAVRHGPSAHGPFKDGQVLNAILKKAFARTGLTPPCRYVGSHVLRHSLATNLIRQGASLPEMSDMLRHRSRASTMIYAKLDIEGLRSIAQPWPISGRRAMSRLAEELDRYLTIRRSLGYDLGTTTRCCAASSPSPRAQGAEHVGTDLFLRWQGTFGRTPTARPGRRAWAWCGCFAAMAARPRSSA